MDMFSNLLRNRRLMAPYDDEETNDIDTGNNDQQDYDENYNYFNNKQTVPTNKLSALMGDEEKHPLSDKYRDFIMNQMPNQADYKPGIGRKILAGIAAMGSNRPEQVANMINAPYEGAMKKYYERAKALGTGAALEERDLNRKQQQKYGEARLGMMEEQNQTRAAQERLNEQKNENIRQQKINELNQKISDANARLEMVTRKMEADQSNKDAINEWHKATMESINARHALDIAQRDRQLDETKRAHDIMKQRADSYGERLKQLGEPVQTEETITDAQGKPAGKKITVRGRAGQQLQNQPSNERVKVIGPDGQTGTVPKGGKLPDGWKIVIQ